MSETVFAIPAYQGEKHLHEALESLLAQSDDVEVLVVDDASSDATEQVVRRLQATEPRLHYLRHAARIGMVANWRFAFLEARRRWPEMAYFAWASDHDLWHPRWLSSLRSTLETAPGAVLAYPLNIRISAAGGELRPATEQRGGRLVPKAPWRFDTTGELRPRRRLMRAARGMSAGNMVYGLWRADALARAGIFHPVLAPDRLVIAQAALLGQFAQVPEILWYRRFRVAVNDARQRRALFAGRPRALGLLPWWLSHPVVIGWRFGVRGAGRPLIGRAASMVVTNQYLIASGAHYVRRRVRKRRRRTTDAVVRRVERLRERGDAVKPLEVLSP